MILKKLNAKASQDNALQLTEFSGLCCGNKVAGVVCQYVATIGSVGSTTAVSSVKIGGVVYTLDGAYLIAQERERNLLIANLEKIVADLGYTGKGNITQSYASTTLTVTVEFSDLEFDYLSADTSPFIPTVCKILGETRTPLCEAQASIVKSGTNLVVKIYNLAPVTNVNINDGGGAIYNGDLTDGTTGNATVTTVAGVKIITVNGASGGENWSGSTTFTTIITLSAACNSATWTRVQKLVY